MFAQSPPADPKLTRVRRAFDAAAQRLQAATTQAEVEDELSNMLHHLYRLGEMCRRRLAKPSAQQLSKKEFGERLRRGSIDERAARVAMWLRAEDTHKLAHLYTQVFARAASAHKLMAPFNAYSRGWAKRFGVITNDEEVDYLGDEGWLLETDANGPEVTYHWRRGNLVVEAHLQCFGVCPADVAVAARVWAETIDETARAGS